MAFRECVNEGCKKQSLCRSRRLQDEKKCIKDETETSLDLRTDMLCENSTCLD